MGMTLSRQVDESREASFEHDFKLALITGDLDALNQLLKIEAIETQVFNNIPLVLFWGAKTENIKCFERLLRFPEIRQQISAVNHWCFFESCRYGNIDVLNCLLDFDDVLEVVSSRENFALSQAILGGHKAVIHRLLELDAVKATLKTQGETLLYAACHNGIYEAATALLENPQIKDELSHQTFRCVRIVLKMGYSDLLEHLIEFDNVKSYLLEHPNCLEKAIFKQDVRMLESLLSIDGMAHKITSEHMLRANLVLAEILYHHATQAGIKFSDLPVDSVQAQHILSLQISAYQCLKLRRLNFQEELFDEKGQSLRELTDEAPHDEVSELAYGLKIFMNLPKDLAHETLSYLPLMRTKIPHQGGSQSMSAHLDEQAVSAIKSKKGFSCI